MTMYTRNFAGNNNTGAGSGSSSGNNVLWMGDVSTRVPDSHSCSAQQVDAAMDEHRLMQSFSELNEPVEYVRVMRPKDGMG